MRGILGLLLQQEIIKKKGESEKFGRGVAP